MPNRKPIVFIVGLPRSGTKLLRDLLNEHSEVSIPYVESQIFPDLINKYGLQTLSESDRNEVHESVKSGIFSYNLEKDYGLIYDSAAIDQLCTDDTIAGFIQGLLTYYGPTKEARIIGDKTPSYLGKIASLRKAFPDLKLIHIIRDPRDRALSAKNIWGTPLLDSAEKWTLFIQKAKPIIGDLGKNALQIRYEDLLGNPESSLWEICSFLDLEFESSMMELNISTEKYGDASRRKTIDKGNLNKFEQKMNANQIKRIEEVCFKAMQEWSYPIQYATQEKRLSRFEKKYLWALGGSKMVSFHIKDKGLIKGVWYFLKGRQTKKWKNK